MDFIIENALQRGEREVPEFVADAKIVVVGSGGAGNNSVTRLMEMGGVRGATSVIVNTDAQHLNTSKADKKLLIGYDITKGLGAGGFPDIGRKSVEASKGEVSEVVKDANMVFLTCGLGGGTGTGSLPKIAEIAKREGAIVVATVTMPFDMEKARQAKAEEGLEELREHVDTAIVIDNNKLLDYVPHLPINQAFGVADELIAMMIKGISETITVPSLINLDYADIKAIMRNGGVAMIGVGNAEGKNMAEEAVHNALNHPLLEVSYEGANGAVIHITGGPDMTLQDATTAGKLVSETLSKDAQVIWGARIDPQMKSQMRIMAIITGINSPYIVGSERSVIEGIPTAIESPLGVKEDRMLKELNIDVFA